MSVQSIQGWEKTKEGIESKRRNEGLSKNNGVKTDLHFASKTNSTYFCNYCGTSVGGNQTKCYCCGGDFSHIPTNNDKWQRTYRKGC